MRESLISLWQIETELAELLNAREELIELGEDLTYIEQAIAEYVQREIKKVDGIRGYVKHAGMMAAAANMEAVVQKERAIAWQGRIDRLKEFCRRTMEAMTWTEGKPKRIEGKLGSLTLATNGGKQEVVITQESLLPETLVQYEGRISGIGWKAIREAMIAQLRDHHARGFKGLEHDDEGLWKLWLESNSMDGRHVQMTRAPHKGRIAEALSAKCPQCGGSGERLPSGPSDAPVEQCPACDGDKLARVPGAHFASRGCHIVVK